MLFEGAEGPGRMFGDGSWTDGRSLPGHRIHAGLGEPFVVAEVVQVTRSATTVVDGIGGEAPPAGVVRMHVVLAVRIRFGRARIRRRGHRHARTSVKLAITALLLKSSPATLGPLSPRTRRRGRAAVPRVIAVGA
jgi:hypothetical protein